jgi:uncharacterized protein
MRFEWDDWKNRRNLAKHKISFDTARLVFEDPNVLVQEDRVAEGEQRWQALGLIGGVVVVLVVYTCREQEGDEVIRVISARKATTQERKAYDEAYQSPG